MSVVKTINDFSNDEREILQTLISTGTRHYLDQMKRFMNGWPSIYDDFCKDNTDKRAARIFADYCKNGLHEINEMEQTLFNEKDDQYTKGKLEDLEGSIRLAELLGGTDD